jgi:chromosome segregation ATPase
MKSFGMRKHRTPAGIVLLIIGLIVFFPLVAVAQTNTQKKQTTRPPETGSAGKSSSSDDDAPLTTFEEEIRAKRAIKIAEKEHQANLDRAHEISQLGKELQEALKQRESLEREDNKKLDRLEKLTKKVRGDAGGEASEVKLDSQPGDLAATVGRLVEVTDSLSKSVQSTPRQVVSTAVIDNANVLLELIRMMRSFSR